MGEFDIGLMIVLFIGAFIPLVEYFLAIPVGILLMGEPAIPVVIVTIVGNSLGVVAVVYLGDKIRSMILRRRKRDVDENLEQKPSKRQERTKRYLEKYGMPGVGILGSFLLSSHLSAAAAVALGIPRGKAIVWTVVGVVLWSIVFGYVAVFASHWFDPFLAT